MCALGINGLGGEGEISGRSFGFTGSQFGCETADQVASLRAEFRRLFVCGFEWMRNGDCIGSDHRAAACWRHAGGKIHLHPPTKSHKRAYIDAERTEPPKDYLARNWDIAMGGEELVATPQEMFEQQRSGTWATVRYARKLGRPVTIVWPDGSITRERAHPLPSVEGV